MDAPFEPIDTTQSTIEKIQKTGASDEEIQAFLATLTSSPNNENNFKIFCEALLQSQCHDLHPTLEFVVQQCRSKENRATLLALCKQYSEISGLASYFLANYEPEFYSDRTKQFQVLQRAAALNNVNAMIQLYLGFFRKERSSADTKLVINAEQAWLYLTQGAKLGSSYCRLQVANAYLGKSKVFSKKVNLDKGMRILLSAVPSYTGNIEYELFLLLRWGFYSDDFQCIAPNPTKAYAYLQAAAGKAANYAECLTEYDQQKKLNQIRVDGVPKDIRDCLLRIRNHKQQGKDKILVCNYINSFKGFVDLRFLLGFLLDQHFIYLPPFIFDTLCKSIVKIQKQNETKFKLEDRFRDSSPLIESLFHPRSLAKLHHANPHAEYLASVLYRHGNSHYHNNDTIGMNGNSCLIEIRQNSQLAEQYLRRAASNGHAFAQRLLGKRLLDRKQETEGKNFLVQAAEQYDIDAIFDLFNHYWTIFNHAPQKNLPSGTQAIYFYSLALACDHIEEEDFHKKKDLFERMIKDPEYKDEYSAVQSPPRDNTPLLGKR